MLCEMITGVAGIHLDHQSVAGDFRDDAGGSYGIAQSVASHQSRLLNGKRVDGAAVDEDMPRLDRQRRYGAAHGFVRRTENIEPVHFFRVDDGNRPVKIPAGGQILVKLLPNRRAKLLGVGQDGMRKTRRQDGRSSDDGPGEGSPPGLVNPGNDQFQHLRWFRSRSVLLPWPDALSRLGSSLGRLFRHCAYSALMQKGTAHLREGSVVP